MMFGDPPPPPGFMPDDVPPPPPGFALDDHPQAMQGVPQPVAQTGDPQDVIGDPHTSRGGFIGIDPAQPATMAAPIARSFRAAGAQMVTQGQRVTDPTTGEARAIQSSYTPPMGPDGQYIIPAGARPGPNGTYWQDVEKPGETPRNTAERALDAGGEEAWKLSPAAQAEFLRVHERDASVSNKNPVLRNTAGWMNGVSLGTAPAIEGGLGAAIRGMDNATGRHLPQGPDGANVGMGDEYSAMKVAEHARLRQMEHEKPIVTYGGEVGGSLMAPGMGAAGTFVRGAKSAGGAMVRSGAVGAGFGALAGAGGSAPGDEVKGAATGALYGGGLGAVAPPLISSAAKITAPVRRGVQNVAADLAPRLGVPQRYAPTRAQEPLSAVQKTIVPTFTGAGAADHPSDFIANMQRGVLPVAAGNPIVTQVGEMVANSAGRGREALRSAIAERQAGEGDRILQAFDNHLGVSPDAARGDIDAIVAKGQADAAPHFDAVRAQPGPVWNRDLARIANRPVVKKALAGAAEDLLNADRDPKLAGLAIDRDTGALQLDPNTKQPVPELQPTAEAWDLARRRLNSMVERDGVGRIIPDSQSPGNHNINQANRDLVSVLAGDESGNGAMVPSLRKALDVSGDYLSSSGTFKAAKGKLTGNMPVADFAKMHATFNTPAKQAAAQAAYANDLMEAFDNNRLKPGQFDKPGVEKKMQIAFGDKAQGFLDAMDQAQHERQIYGGITGGSATQYRQSLDKIYGHAQGPLSPQNMLEWTAPLMLAAHDPAAGGALLAAKGVKAFMNRSTKAATTPWQVPKLAEGMGKILSDPQAMEALIRQHQAVQAAQQTANMNARKLAPRVVVPLLATQGR